MVRLETLLGKPMKTLQSRLVNTLSIFDSLILCRLLISLVKLQLVEIISPFFTIKLEFARLVMLLAILTTNVSVFKLNSFFSKRRSLERIKRWN